MAKHGSQDDYQAVTRARTRTPKDAYAIAQDWPAQAGGLFRSYDSQDVKTGERSNSQFSETGLKESSSNWLKRGHTFSYAALFLFTVILYARPSEFYPSAVTASLALVAGAITVAFFVPSQLSMEGTLTARPREVSLVLLFALTGLLSIPLAISPAVAWHEFSDTFIRCIVIFIVVVNAVRTEARLKGLLYLAIAVSVWLSFGAINDYRLGLLTVEGYRVGGRGSGIFGNSNDMALYLVTIVPVAVALLLGARSVARKLLFGSCTLLMIAAVVLTYSRGGFIGLMIALAFLAWRVGSRHRAEILILGFMLVAGFLAVAPGGYALRLASIFVPSLDPVGSADARRGELMRSLYIALRHPFLGIGMGNYAPEMSYHGLVTHNSYTQVAAEMGMAALYCYTMFIVTPLRNLVRLHAKLSRCGVIRVFIICRSVCRRRWSDTWCAAFSPRSPISGTSFI